MRKLLEELLVTLEKDIEDPSAPEQRPLEDVYDRCGGNFDDAAEVGRKVGREELARELRARIQEALRAQPAA